MKKIPFYDAAIYGANLEKEKVRFNSWHPSGYGQWLSNRLEIDITHDCDLNCIHCDRSCGKAPTKEGMSVEQIRRFIDESLEQNHFWYIIKFTGGESTQHPDLVSLMVELERYKKVNPRTLTWLNTNGLSNKTKGVIQQIRNQFPWMVINSSAKTTSNVKHHTAFNIAPIDFDITKAPPCHRAWDCGIGLNRYGFYPCGAGGGIDRVFGFDIGIKSLANLTHEAILTQFLKLCPYCGHSPTKAKEHNVAEEKMSQSWVDAYRKYKENKPTLRKIYT